MSVPFTIFLGSGSLSDEIRTRLTDLAAVGVTRPFAWIDLAQSTAGAPIRFVSSTSEETVRYLPLDDVLQTATHLSQTMLAVLIDPLDDGSDRLDVSAVNEWISTLNSRLPRQLQRVRVLVPRQPLNHVQPVPLMSFSSVAIAAEDSAAPGSAMSPVVRSDDPVGAAEVAAPTIATMCGLWITEKSSALIDDRGHAIATGDEYSFRLARAFYRNINASTAEAELRSRAIDISQDLPRPQTIDGRQIMVLQRPDEVLPQVSDLLIGNYYDSLITAPAQVKGREATQTSAWAALSDFSKKFFRSLIGTPQDWKAAASATLHRGVAQAVQRNLYGDTSGVEIVLGSYQGQGQNRSLSEFSREASRAAATANEISKQEGLSVDPPPALSDMWNGYQSMALTLVDGTDRLGGKLAAPRDSQNNPMIVPEGWLSVPDVDESFEGFHPLLEDAVAMTEENATILPFDSFTAENYAQDLEFVSGQSSDPTIQRLRSNFNEWRNKYARSYAWQTGQRLTNLVYEAQHRGREATIDLHKTTQELDQLRQRDYAEENARLTKRLHIFTAIWAVVMIILLYCGIAHYVDSIKFYNSQPTIDWKWTVFGVFVATILTLGTQTFVFARGRRGIATDQARHEELVEKQEVALTNRNAALQDINRLTGAYQQFLAWSKLAGRAISRPLGNNVTQKVRVANPTDGMPRTTQFGEAKLSEEDIQQLTFRLRNEIYNRDWAGDAFDRTINSAIEALKRSQGIAAINVNDLYGQPGANSHSNLDRLSQVATSDALDGYDFSGEEWTKALLNPNISELLSSKLNQVIVFDDGMQKNISQQEFLAPLTESKVDAGLFASQTIAGIGASSGATTVDPAVSMQDQSLRAGEQGNGLSKSAILVQFGGFTHLSNLANEASFTTPTKLDHPTDITFHDPGTIF
ncbi:hypothetical protein QP027_11080 [Corynebacterium breve]|uniref:Uncharacterized protein n=1 Tax=Corynebacterium breve TaxID=3049799 RepID=A0ABY8VET2_9CORY|nr:hypothetical protein [Corynebacterium breve]WIM67612.1 hypothetical protein QP027_11080 [Corynebacterium breve]